VAVAQDPAGDKEQTASEEEEAGGGGGRKPERGTWPVAKHGSGAAWVVVSSRTK
jgi:hypothetical protein